MISKIRPDSSSRHKRISVMVPALLPAKGCCASRPDGLERYCGSHSDRREVATKSRAHQAKQHRLGLAGIEARSICSGHVFPPHAHDQYGIGVISAGAQRSWSLLGAVDAGAGDVIMLNPGEMHDGAPLGPARRWHMV